MCLASIFMVRPLDNENDIFMVRPLDNLSHLHKLECEERVTFPSRLKVRIFAVLFILLHSEVMQGSWSYCLF